MPGQYQHGGAETDGACACRDPGEQLQRRRNLVPAREVVFYEKGSVITEGLCLYVKFHVFLKPITQAGPGPPTVCIRTAENSELHLLLLGRCFASAASTELLAPELADRGLGVS